jgi:hypothetical protein
MEPSLSCDVSDYFFHKKFDAQPMNEAESWFQNPALYLVGIKLLKETLM